MFLKKLLYITTNIQDSGGVSRILSIKLNYLIETYKYDISVINSNQKGDGFFYHFNNKIKFYYINTKHLFNYKKELNILINKVAPDIIINCDNGLKGSLLTFLIGNKIPLIYEKHCSKNLRVKILTKEIKLKLSNILLQMSIEKYNGFIVLNEEERSDWHGKNIQIIPNPSWINVPSESIKIDCNVIIAVGRHSYEKRYDKLIEIWKHIMEKHPNSVLKIYGEKSKDIPLKEMVLQQKLEGKIQLYDPINDVEKIYSEASMLLSTSESEAFGLVLIEAMAFGKPVIAFDGTSGTKTIIENGKNGFLVKENDIDAFVEKVNLLIEDVNLRDLMGENARKSIVKYNMESVMILWHRIFQNL